MDEGRPRADDGGCGAVGPRESTASARPDPRGSTGISEAWESIVGLRADADPHPRAVVPRPAGPGPGGGPEAALAPGPGGPAGGGSLGGAECLAGGEGPEQWLD